MRLQISYLAFPEYPPTFLDKWILSYTPGFAFCSVTFAPMSAGRRPGLWPGQRRVKPSQPAPGGVWRTPARPQPPLQGRAAEGVEWTGSSCSGHLSSAEGPTHIKLQKPSRFGPTQPHIFISDLKETVIQKSVSIHGKYCSASTLPFSFCMRSHPSDSVDSTSSTPLLFPSVIPCICSKAVLSVGVVLLSPSKTAMQVNSISA